MGRSPCCDKVGLKKGPWTPEEDQKLLDYIKEHGHGSWRALPSKAGLQRCGKSCRLRWINYLRPDIKRGKFSLQEEQTIIQLHALLGNRWSAIATHLPKRTDNEIKNYWNTHLKKRLAKMGIDPITHKPKNDSLLTAAGDAHSKNAANLSHIAQWESARLEAEARLVRESRLRITTTTTTSSSIPHGLLTKPDPPTSLPSRSLDPLKPWNHGLGRGIGGDHHLESPTSTLTFTGSVGGGGENSIAMIEFVGSSSSCGHHEWKEEGFGNSSSNQLQEYKEGGFENNNNNNNNSMSFTSHEMTLSIDHQHHHQTTWTNESLRTTTTKDHNNNDDDDAIVEEGFTNLLLNNNNEDDDDDEHERSESNDDHDDEDGGEDQSENGSGSCDYYEDNKNYWNSILNLVNSSPSDSSIF